MYEPYAGHLDGDELPCVKVVSSVTKSMFNLKWWLHWVSFMRIAMCVL